MNTSMLRLPRGLFTGLFWFPATCRTADENRNTSKEGWPITSGMVVLRIAIVDTVCPGAPIYPQNRDHGQNFGFRHSNFEFRLTFPSAPSAPHGKDLTTTETRASYSIGLPEANAKALRTSAPAATTTIGIKIAHKKSHDGFLISNPDFSPGQSKTRDARTG
jgi:hypothetical protein